MEKHILALEATGDKANRNSDMSLEDKALEMAIEEMYESTGSRWKPWARNARSLRVGDIILIVDSDTIVPEVSKMTIRQVGASLQLNHTAIRIPSEMLPASLPSLLRLLSFNTSQASACMRAVSVGD